MRLIKYLLLILFPFSNTFGETVDSLKTPIADNYSDCFTIADTAKYRDSVNYYSLLIALYPDSADFYGKRAYYKVGLNDETGSGADYLKAVQLRSTYLAAIYSLGLHYFVTNDFDKAETTFRRALKQSPNDSDVKYMLGILLYKMDRYKEALPYLLTTNQVGKYKILALEVAGSCAIEVEDYQTALECYNMLLEDIKKEEYYCLKANALGYLKRYSEANYYFNYCLQLNPDYSDVYYYRGFMRYNRGQLNAACKDFYLAAIKHDADAQKILCEECERLCQKLNY
ncbi:MAG TPA: tetratricopeptide repeat protein [Chitinophagales bacterium]|nr:tetratricopeptide repeat protein [Chitinophagales bacterium]